MSFLSPRLIAATLLCSTAMAASAHASDYLTAHVGYFDILRKKDTAADFGLEYRFKPMQYGFRPTLGASVTSDGGVYGFGGFNWEVPLIENQVYLIPNFMVGLHSDGDGRKLGGPIEFRSGIELAYQLPNTHRVGIAFNHISNASIYDRNPGAETLLVNYSVPLNLF